MSTPERRRTLARLGSRRWDLLVVGGGISGCAVARDAALRGLRVALVEQADFAYGTSSRSSRLIHGGLRYLAHLDFGLVREGLVERRRLLDSAPGLVRRVEFLYAVYRGDPDPLWKVDLGVGLYELMALGYGLGGRRRLSAARVARLVPALRDEGLKGGVRYRDAATHDTRLTLAVALSAARAGAQAVSRCRAVELEERSGRVRGARLEDRVTGRRLTARARAVVLCCGPWQGLYGSAPVRLKTARGTHLSLARGRLPLPCHVALRSPRDGRLAFAMPIAGHTVLGTTDVSDSRSPGAVRATPADTRYLLELAAAAFPGAGVTADDVTGVWAGLRPLVSAEPGAPVDEISREHRVVPGPPGLWILTGGKLTTHRLMAEDLLEEILPRIDLGGRAVGPCLTRERPLVAGSVEQGRRELEALGLGFDEVEELAELYGGRLEHLATRLAARCGGRRASPADLVEVQTRLAVREEWALSLDDLLLRRVGPGTLDLAACRRAAPEAAERMAALLGWSEEQRREQRSGFEALIDGELDAAGLDPVRG